MKQITMMSGKEIIISDEEATNIRKVIESGKAGLIQLRDGNLVNLSSVETITEPETEAYFMGNKMNRDCTKVFVQGEWKFFSGDKSEIEYRLKTNEKQNEESKLLQ